MASVCIPIANVQMSGERSMGLCVQYSASY
jgi:hypothetical protein